MRDQIVDAALELAETDSWEAVRLRQIASRLDVPLETIRQEFAEKEDIVDAWFDRADRAMLALTDDPGWEQLQRRDKVFGAIMAWLDALGAHKRPTRQMIANKFELGHLHYQVAGTMRVSRTVQWIREVAGFEDTLPWRAFSEAGLTGIYLATFFRWMADSSSGAADTRRFLDRCLNIAGEFPTPG